MDYLGRVLGTLDPYSFGGGDNWIDGTLEPNGISQMPIDEAPWAPRLSGGTVLGRRGWRA